MYFNHAFRKTLLGKNDGGVLLTTTTGSTSDLTAGELGFFDAKTYQAFAGTNSGQPFIIAQGSYFTKDKISPFHGGYQESVKTKVINPKYITRVFTACSTPPQNQIDDVCVCNLECGKTYNLRLDLKGSPALRFLSHNIYKTLAAYTGCCTDDCSATCTGALVDPTTVIINWAKQIAQDPFLPSFIHVAVTDFNGDPVADQDNFDTVAEFVAALDAYSPTPAWDPAATDAAELQACLTIKVAYIDTKFGYCTFTPTDFYELQPLKVLESMTDETGDPCNVQCFEVNPVQEAVQAQGLGETVLRELILAGRYRQEAYPDSSRVESLRMREIEANPVLETVDRAGFYNSINILHSVPRFNNPTGTFDNDQYLITIYFPAFVCAQTFVNQLQEILDYCCPGLEIENFTAGDNSNCTCSTTTTSTTAGPIL
jgi:hypothetical protein